MKNKSKSCLIALAATVMILFLILGPSAASAAPLAIAETKITNSGNASNADIYGNRIVWQDTRNGENPDIYVYDTSTKRETRITKSGSAVNPAIYGNLIVYEKYVIPNPEDPWNHISDVYTYDLSAKKETRITKTGNVSNPDIYGNKIVWDGDGIFLYDLSAKKITQIAKDSYVEDDYSSQSVSNHNPIIFGNKIVWISTSTYSDSFEPSSTNILYIYDLSKKKETKIDEDSFFYSAIYSHDIYNNRIVWYKDYKDPNDTEIPGIFMYDLSTKKYTQITYYAGLNPRIYGNRIVWDNSIYDLSTKNETKITTSGSASNPRIYGDRIVWQDSRNGYPVSDIYLGTLSSKPAIVASFSASPVSGKAPLKVQFTDKSTASPTSWSWNFGDKTTSTAKNPAHTYSKVGKYTVSLTVKNAAGSNTVTKSGYINVINPPVAAFSAYPVTGKAPLTVKFADKSTGSPASWSWNFGDKSVSTAKNPSHKYAKAGKYTVSLTVKNAAGSNITKKTNYITIK